MTAREIIALVNQHPFQPLKFQFSDGTIETVERPDNIVVLAGSVGIGQFDEDERVPSWLKTYSLFHLVNVVLAQPSDRTEPL